jgi:hypothetical protein
MDDRKKNVMDRYSDGEKVSTGLPDGLFSNQKSKFG